MSPTSTARILALLLISASLLAACGATPSSPSAQATEPASPSPTPTAPSASAAPSASGPAPSEDAAATYARINREVQEIRGLDERTPVEPRIVSPDELSAVIRGSFDKDYPPDKVALDERLYQRLGLLDPDQALAEVYVDLLESQVAGLYDPATEQLYVLSKAGGVGPVEQVFYSHEYDHALQDQHFDLEAYMDGLDGQSDRQLARQALVEGDAYVLMTYWLQQHLGPSELAEVIAASSDPEALAALDKIPPIVQAQLLFAATQGTQWAIGQQIAGGWEAIDQAFANPPASTEQILHADKWASREAPIAVSAPDELAARLGDGWSVALEDTLGEYQAGIWLGAGTEDAAAGWGGDRLTMVEGPDGAWGIGWRTAWDTTQDANEFTDAAQVRLRDLPVPSRIVAPGGSEVTILIASDDAGLLALDKVYGATGV
jgi:hypothetical protein